MQNEVEKNVKSVIEKTQSLLRGLFDKGFNTLLNLMGKSSNKATDLQIKGREDNLLNNDLNPINEANNETNRLQSTEINKDNANVFDQNEAIDQKETMRLRNDNQNDNLENDNPHKISPTPVLKKRAGDRVHNPYSQSTLTFSTKEARDSKKLSAEIREIVSTSYSDSPKLKPKKDINILKPKPE